MLIMSMIPAAALAADDDGYGLWVDGTEVTVDNADNVLGDDTVSYNAETKTLTLNGAEIDTAHTDGSYTSGIYAEGDINIVLRGSSSINISGGQITAGVHANGVISISGGGSLGITAGGAGIETRAISTDTPQMKPAWS